MMVLFLTCRNLFLYAETRYLEYHDFFLACCCYSCLCEIRRRGTLRTLDRFANAIIAHGLYATTLFLSSGT